MSFFKDYISSKLSAEIGVDHNFKEHVREKLLKKNYKNLINEIHNVIGVPFFIVGGSLFSCLTGSYNEYTNDIDIFFYNREDYEDAILKMKFQNIHNETSNTDNAFSFTTTIFKHARTGTTYYQFIKAVHGSPQKVFNSIDLNTSKIAITSDLEVVTDESFDVFLKVDERNISSTTADRMTKYIMEKNAKYKTNGSFLKVFEYCVRQKTAIADMYGFQIKPMYALLLANCKLSNHFNKIMFDEVCETELSFEEISEAFDDVRSLTNNIINYFSESPGSNHKILLSIRNNILERIEEPPIQNLNSINQVVATKERNLVEYMASEKFSDMRRQYPEYFI